MAGRGIKAKTPISVSWGAFTIKSSRTLDGASRAPKSQKQVVYSSMLNGTANRIGLIKNQRSEPKGMLLRRRPGRGSKRGELASLEPKIGSTKALQRTGALILFQPKIQRQFKDYVQAVGSRDYNAIIAGNIRPSQCRWSRIGVPRPLSKARVVSNMCRFTDTGCFKFGGKTFVLSKRGKGEFKRVKFGVGNNGGGAAEAPSGNAPNVVAGG